MEKQKTNYNYSYLIAMTILFVTLLIVLLFSLSKGKLIYISGVSMEPTLENNTLKWFGKAENIERGDIVVFTTPKDWEDKDRLYIKRIVGMPGDSLEIKEDRLIINDKEVYHFPEHYKNKVKMQMSICQTHCFVMGDNQEKSIDSLYYILSDQPDKALVPFDSIQYSAKIEKR